MLNNSSGLIKTVCAFSLAALTVSGCTPSLQQCSLVSGSGTWRNGQYDVHLVLSNASETETVDVPKLTFRVTAYDENGEVVSENLHVEADESLAPLDLTRIHLRVSDEDARVRHCRIVLQDERGRVICEYAIDADGEEDAHPGHSVFSASDLSIR